MAAPQFTVREQYVINHLKSSASFDYFLFDFASLSGAGLFVLIGIWTGDSLAILTGMGLIVGVRLWERSYQPQYLAALKSVIRKYELETFVDSETCDRQFESQPAGSDEAPRLRFGTRSLLVFMLLVGTFCAGWTANVVRTELRTQAPHHWPVDSRNFSRTTQSLLEP